MWWFGCGCGVWCVWAFGCFVCVWGSVGGVFGWRVLFCWASVLVRALCVGSEVCGGLLVLFGGCCCECACVVAGACCVLCWCELGWLCCWCSCSVVGVSLGCWWLGLLLVARVVCCVLVSVGVALLFVVACAQLGCLSAFAACWLFGLRVCARVSASCWSWFALGLLVLHLRCSLLAAVCAASCSRCVL